MKTEERAVTRQDIICSTALQFKKERSIFIKMEDINVKDKKLFEVELLGIRALFTTMRIDKSSIPEGMYYYNLKHDGDDRYPSAVENDSAENYFGAVLTVERLDFQAKSFLPLGHDDFCFTDEKFYAEDFIAKYGLQSRTIDKPEES